MVYSTGDSAADLKTGSPTCEVSGTTITFSTAQTGNIGVGDEITYNTTDKCYIVGKTSTTVWTVRSATAGTPAAASAGTTVNQIKHTFASLNAALNNFFGASYLNSTNLTTADVQVDIACYRDSADMTGAVASSATTVTTDGTRFVRVYTPYDTTAECNNNQRHNGIWASQGYLMSHTAAALYIFSIRDIRVEGLQIYQNGTANGAAAVKLNRNTSGGEVVLRDCLIRVRNTSASSPQYGLDLSQGTVPVRVVNCAFSGVITSGGTITAITAGGGPALRALNNTIYGVTTGILRSVGTTVTINNVVEATTCFSGTQTQSYNASTDATASGTGSRTTQTFTFEDAANGDLRLNASDAGAKGYGTDLSADSVYPFSLDFIRTTRTVPWDIGAHQVSVASSGGGRLVGGGLVNGAASRRLLAG